MNTPSLDSIAKTLGLRSHRRAALTMLVAAALGGPEMIESAAAKSGKCTPACGECHTCHRGSCHSRHGKKQCRRGRCLPVTDDTVCNGTGRCLGGVCNSVPICLGVFAECSVLDPDACCSGVCNNDKTCDIARNPGDPCLDDAQCFTANCVGFRCQ